MNNFSVFAANAVQKRLEFYYPGAGCERNPGILNHYFLFPGADGPLNYLMMVTMTDPMRAAAVSPDELKKIHDLDIKYQYNFTE
jgi:hypothetical protein